jgi:hypothetical protein
MTSTASLEREHVELVNHPSHYLSEAGIEVIDVIERYGFDRSFHLASALKYLLRAGKKSADSLVTDLEKASWYAKRWDDGSDGVIFEVPIASPGAVEWQSPEAIIEAFGLEGGRARAVLTLLTFAAANATDEEISGEEIDLVLAAVAGAIEEAKQVNL